MKFGLIIPSSNTTMEAEFWRMASGWATVHTTRLRLRKITVDELEETEGMMIEASMLLADSEVDVIGYGCTSGSFFKGKGHDREIEEKIAEITGIPAVATAKAVVEALDELHLNRVCVVTPYTEEINKLEKEFLEQSGMEVLRMKGLNITNNIEVGSKEPSAAYELAKETYAQGTQGMFISCTNFRTIEVIERLEKELNVPVISSNTATFWAMMKKAGSGRKIKGYGRL
ncbi:MAG: maleate cis-trans isomerase, partial [Candidatus Aminicenantes bacterium]|nr:maleate cis-trans isomerase [Candidatus Aminicenantes bacterium]